MKRRLGFIFSVLVLATLLTTTVFAKDSGAVVFVNGKALEEKAVIKDNRVFVPMRVISEKLGFNVNYQATGKKISLKRLSHEVELFTGKRSANINGIQGTIEVAPFVRSNVTYVPLRLIIDVLGERVEWDGKNKIVIVGSLEEYREQDNTYIYENKEFAYALEVPNNWDNTVLIENKNGILSFYNKPTLNRLKEEGIHDPRPVFQIKANHYPTVTDNQEDDNVLLMYHKGRYIEALFDKDMQYHKDAMDSYLKTREQGKRIITSIKPL